MKLNHLLVVSSKKLFFATLTFLTFISSASLHAQATENAVKPRHFVLRLNPTRAVQSFLAYRNFPEYHGLSLEIAPIKMFSVEFEPGFANLSTIDHVPFETGWGIDKVIPGNTWSPTGRITGRFYPFANSQSKPREAFEGFWLGLQTGYGQWGFNSLELYSREHEYTPDGQEYSNYYSNYSNGTLSRSYYFGGIGNNFMLDKNNRLNLGLYFNAGAVRYSIKYKYATYSSTSALPTTYNNGHDVKKHFAIQTGVTLGYAF